MANISAAVQTMKSNAASCNKNLAYKIIHQTTRATIQNQLVICSDYELVNMIRQQNIAAIFNEEIMA